MAKTTNRGNGHTHRYRNGEKPVLPGQSVLVLQGGGALGAYQVGVYEAMHEAGVEPDWVIGTSIGAINAAIIAGNAPEDRIARLTEFWSRVEHGAGPDYARMFTGLSNLHTNLHTVTRGIPAFFAPNPLAWLGSQAKLGIEQAAYYTTAPLRETLAELIDLDRLSARHVRLTVGAVNARTGEMRYFDSREAPVCLDHVLASGALPPAFPAVRIDGDPYWDGGIYSNTPIEVVLDDVPRRNSLIFSVNVWQPVGAHPTTIQQVMARHKDIQFASRGKSHVARQAQIHRLRHVVRELARRLPPEIQADPVVQDMAEYGCGTLMHLVRLLSPRLDGEDHTKDIDFTRSGIENRWKAGYDHARKVLAEKPWRQQGDMLAGIVIHDANE